MGSTLIPCLRYQDAHAAIDWLCRNFGFQKRTLIPNRNGGVAHAELVLGDGMVMLGSHVDDRLAGLIVPPDRVGGVQTQTTWVQVADADDVYARVVDSGARVVQEIDDAPFGGRSFACRDPEGHVWHVGTWDAWASAAP